MQLTPIMRVYIAQLRRTNGIYAAQNVSITSCMPPFNRHDTSIDPMVYQTTLSRTLSKIKDCAQGKKLGVIHEPLLNIEVSNVRIIV